MKFFWDTTSWGNMQTYKVPKSVPMNKKFGNPSIRQNLHRVPWLVRKALNSCSLVNTSKLHKEAHCRWTRFPGTRKRYRFKYT